MVYADMTKIQTGWLLAGSGLILVLVALVKFSVIGYYPSELPLYVTLLVVGAGLMWVGNRSYRSGKMGK